MKFLSFAMLAFSLSAQAGQPTILKVEGTQDFSTNFYMASHPVYREGKYLGSVTPFIRFYNMTNDREHDQVPELYFAISAKGGVSVLVDSGVKQEARAVYGSAGISSCAAIGNMDGAGKVLLTELSRGSEGLRLDYYVVDITSQALRNAIEKSVCDVDAKPRASIKEFIPSAEPFFTQKINE